MSNYNSLKTTIDANIKQNGRQEITGPILNSVLNQMVTTLGAGYQFAGVATTATNPGSPDAKVFYIANGKGKYEKFGGLEVTEDEVVVLYWDSAWHKVATGIASQEKLSELDGKVRDIQDETYNDEYVEVLVDTGNKILESIGKDGKKTFNVDVQLQGNVNGEPYTKPSETKQYIDQELANISADSVEETYNDAYALTDSESKVIESVDSKGEKHQYSTTHFHSNVEKGGAPILPSPLFGKKWVVFGDSFTNGYWSAGRVQESGIYKGCPNTYPYYIGNRTGITVLKYFEGGRTIGYPSDGTFNNSICNPNAEYYFQNIPEDVDYVTIYLGINDESHRNGVSPDGETVQGMIPLGTINDTDTSTYLGAYNVVLTWLRENRPFAHVGVIITNGLSSKEYVDGQIAVAKKYGYPYLNLNGDERTPALMRCVNDNLPTSVKQMIFDKQRGIKEDGSLDSHPSDATHEYESHIIESFLKSL